MANLYTSGRFQGFDSAGDPLAGGLLYSYLAGTLTPKSTYTTQGGTVANANPVVLDSAGRKPVWLGSGGYRMILKTSEGVTVSDDDGIKSDAPPITTITSGGTSADLQSAFDAAAAGSIVQFEAGAYTLTETVTCDKEIHVLADGAVFTVTTNVPAFEFYVEPEIKALSSSYAPGDLAVSVSALSAALIDGQPFKIVSDAVDPANRDSGSSSSQWRMAEFSHSGPGGTTTSIVLRSPLRFSRGVSPTSTVGEESLIDAYTTSMNARVLVLTGETMSWHGGTIRYTEGNDATWDSRAFSVIGYTRPTISIDVARGYHQGIYLGGCYRASVQNSYIRNLNNNTSLGQYGYGIADASYATFVYGCTFASVRHGYTSAESTASAGDTNLQRLLAVGRMVGAVIDSCYGFGSADAPFDTHHASEDVTFSRCKVEGGSGYAYTLRGRNILLLDCEALNTTYGVLAHTEYQNAETDDDLFVAGKPSGCTTVTIRNFKAKVGSIPFEFSGVRRGQIIGGMVESTDHRLIKNVGSAVTVDGDLLFTVSTQDGARAITTATGVGTFDVDAISGAMVNADWVSSIVFLRGAEVRINATVAVDGATNLRLFDAATSACLVENRGRVRASLSTAFSTLLAGTASSYTGDESGMLLWSISGAADNSITTGLVGTALRAAAVDDSARYDGTGSSSGVERLAYSALPGVAHSGTGVFVTSVYVPEYDAVTSINEAGHYARFELSYTKAGVVGAATIRARIATDFLFDLPLAATDVSGKLVIEVFTTGETAQYVLVNGRSANDLSVVTPASHASQGISEVGNLSAVSSMLQFDVNAAVGDTITFKTTRVYSDTVSFGL